MNLQRFFNLSSTNNNPTDLEEVQISFPYNIVLQPQLIAFFEKKTIVTYLYFIPHRFFDVIDTKQIFHLYR